MASSCSPYGGSEGRSPVTDGTILQNPWRKILKPKKRCWRAPSTWRRGFEILTFSEFAAHENQRHARYEEPHRCWLWHRFHADGVAPDVEGRGSAVGEVPQGASWYSIREQGVRGDVSDTPTEIVVDEII